MTGLAATARVTNGEEPSITEAITEEFKAKRAEFEAKRTEAEAREREIRSDKAERERSEVQQKIEEAKKHREQLKELRRWALQVTDDQQWDESQKPGVWSNYLERWQRSRKLARTQFLHFPDKSRGAVKTGRALNFFLDTCGEAALELETVLRQTRDDLKSAVDPQQQRMLREKLKFLEEIGGPDTLTDYDRQRIRCEIGGAGPKLITNLNDDPLPLDWPVVFRREPEFAPHCDAIQAAKEAALDELVRLGDIQPQTMRRLTDAVDALQVEFQKHYDAFLTGDREKIFHRSIMQFQNAKKFTIGLRHSVVRLLEARTQQDVQIGKFEEKTIGGLLAFMYRNGLRFAEADTNSERTYTRLFQMMTSYYGDVYSVELATKNADRQLALLQQREAFLTRVIYDEGPSAVSPAEDFFREAVLTFIHGWASRPRS